MLGMILAVFVGIVAFAILLALLRIIFEVVLRVLTALAIAAVAGIVGGIIAAQNGYDGGLTGVAAAAACLLPALIAVWKWRGPLAARLHDPDHATTQPASIPVKTLDPIERTIGVNDADAMVAAWEVAERLAPHDDLDRSRQSCARFLAAFDTTSDCEPDAVDLALFIRRHVPGLVTDTRSVLEQADVEERRKTIAAMVSELRLLGEDAERLRVEIHTHARDRLSVRLGRFAYRTAEKGGWR